SAAARAAAISWQTNAPTAGSEPSAWGKQRSGKLRGGSLPAAKIAAAGKKGIRRGNNNAAPPNPSRIWGATFHYPQARPHHGMVGRPQRRIVRARAIETDLAREGLDAVRNPDVIDATVHPRPVRMRDRAVPIGERGEGRRHGLRRAKSGGHQPGRR